MSRMLGRSPAPTRRYYDVMPASTFVGQHDIAFGEFRRRVWQVGVTLATDVGHRLFVSFNGVDGGRRIYRRGIEVDAGGWYRRRSSKLCCDDRRHRGDRSLKSHQRLSLAQLWCFAGRHAGHDAYRGAISWP